MERQFELGREVKPRENEGTHFLLVKHMFIIHQTVSLARGCFKHVTWLNVAQLKLGSTRVTFPNFQNRACCEKYLKDYKHNSLNSARTYALIHDLEHHVFLEAHSFP